MASPDWIETEIKLGLPGENAWQRVRDRLGPGRRVRQTNHFLDLTGGAFGAARIGIRLRAENGERTLTAKGDAGLPSTPTLKRRIELESPIEPEDFDRALREGLDLLPWIERWRDEFGAEAQGVEFLNRLEQLSAGGPLVCFGQFVNHRERCPLRLEMPEGPIEIEVEIDRTEFPGGRVDFEIEVEQTSERGGPGSTNMEEIHRALIDWLESEIGVQTFSATSKLARLNEILATPSDSPR